MILELRLDCRLRLSRIKQNTANSTNNLFQTNVSSSKTKTTFGFRLALFRRRRRRMAIAFYVPPEYGPPRPAQQQQQAAGQPAPDIHTQHLHQDANNNNVIGGGVHGQQGLNNQVAVGDDNLPGFVRRFVQEILRACMVMSGNNQSDSSSPVEQSVSGGGGAMDDERNRRYHQRLHQRRMLAQSRRRSLVQNHQQDNQIAPEVGASPPLPDLIPRSFRALPDIVTCHAGMSFRYGSSSHPSSQHTGLSNDDELLPPSNNNAQQHNHRDREPVQPLSPTSSQSPTTMDFEVSLKLEMCMMTGGDALEANNQEEDLDVPGSLSPEEEFRLAGARLRQIADNFQRTRQRNQSTFEVNVVFSVAVPAVALMAIGLAYLRRS